MHDSALSWQQNVISNRQGLSCEVFLTLAGLYSATLLLAYLPKYLAVRLVILFRSNSAPRKMKDSSFNISNLLLCSYISFCSAAFFNLGSQVLLVIKVSVEPSLGLFTWTHSRRDTAAFGHWSPTEPCMLNQSGHVSRLGAVSQVGGLDHVWSSSLAHFSSSSNFKLPLLY